MNKHIPDRLKAGELFRELAIAIYATGVLDAKPLCILMYYASLAGAVGVDDLGHQPGVSNGNYSRHLKLLLGIRDEDMETYEVDVPLFCKSEWGNFPKHVKDLP